MDSYKIKQGKFSILEMEGKETEYLPPHYLLEYEDVIDEDDVLCIMMQHPTRRDLCQSVNAVCQKGVRVVNGNAFLPEVGNVKLKGLTFTEAQKKIKDAYSEEISGVDIFLEFSARKKGIVELIGEVGARQIPITGRTHLFEVLSLAAISPNSNLFKSYVLRNDQVIPVDLSKLILQGDMQQNIVMYPGDKIFIAPAAAANIMVMGEIGIASVIPVPTGSISLRQALAASGGIPFTGNKQCIQVIRGNVVNPKIYRLSWNHITFLPNDSLLLMPGDTVYITETPITKWNRFINQLLPTNLLFDLCAKYKGACGW